MLTLPYRTPPGPDLRYRPFRTQPLILPRLSYLSLPITTRKGSPGSLEKPSPVRGSTCYICKDSHLCNVITRCYQCTRQRTANEINTVFAISPFLRHMAVNSSSVPDVLFLGLVPPYTAVISFREVALSFSDNWITHLIICRSQKVAAVQHFVAYYSKWSIRCHWIILCEQDSHSFQYYVAFHCVLYDNKE